MTPELTRHLRLRITFGRNPACLDSGGNTEHWKVEVWERFTCQGLIRTSYEITTELEYIHVPDKWDNCTLVPAHRIEIPGCTIEPVTLDNFSKTLKRARERALTISGYMLDEENPAYPDFPVFPRIEEAFEGPKWSSPKKPKTKGIKKAKPKAPPMAEPASTDEEPDWNYYFPSEAV